MPEATVSAAAGAATLERRLPLPDLGLHPALRPGSVPRARLARLRQTGSSVRVVLISAPAGYGKSTLALEWAVQDPRGSSWVQLQRTDNDPVVLLGHVAAAFERIGPVPKELLDELMRRTPRIDDVVLPLLAADFRRRDPFVLVLDDVHALTEPKSLSVLASLIADIPAGSQLMLITRHDPPVHLGRVRASGDLLEIGHALLALDEKETRAVAASGGLELTEQAAAALCERTEGWAAAVALTALSLRGRDDGGARAANRAGDEQPIAEYLLEEVLESQPEHLETFLLGTSVLDRMSPALCDAVLGVHDAADSLESLVRSNAFVIPLDANRVWYRYHHLFGELLRSELGRRHPELVAVYLARAAHWCEQHGSPEEAFGYAHACGDLERAGRIALAHWDEYASHGKSESLRLWLDRCSYEEIAADAQLSIAAAWVCALGGDAARARAFVAAAAEKQLDGPSADGASSVRSSLANLKATLAPDGITQMLEEATFVHAAERANSRWHLGALASIGVAQVLLGRPHEALATLGETLALLEGRANTGHIRVACLGYLAFAAEELDNPRDVRRRGLEAIGVVAREGLENTGYSAIAHVAGALAHRQRGDFTAAAGQLGSARKVQPLLLGFRWLNADLALRSADISLDLGNQAAAIELLDVAADALHGYRDAGTLPARLQRLGERLKNGKDFGLTSAELRLLGFLPTHLSLQEIADRLHVSRATVKTQVASIYDKLGALSRSEAVEVIEDSGLESRPNRAASPDRASG